MLTIGVEEEFFVADRGTGRMVSGGLAGLAELEGRWPGQAGFDSEFQLPLVESRTGICTTLAELRRDLVALRRDLVAAAAAESAAVLAAGTMPTGSWRDAPVTPKPRHERTIGLYQEAVLRRLTCGTHVHVGVADRDLAVRVIGRVCRWLPTLLALSVSSPVSEGADTGHASSRHLLWNSFPVAGQPGAYRSHREYVEATEALVAMGAVLDPGHVYWDVRLGIGHPTIEFRIADSGPRVDDAVLQAALARALVTTAVAEDAAGEPAPPVDPVRYRAAGWRAARSGLDGPLADPVTGRSTDAAAEVGALLAYAGPALAGDRAEVDRLLDRLFTDGTSAERQRRVLATADPAAVVRHLADETAADL